MQLKNLLLIVFVSIMFRSVSLNTVPAWDWDEGANLNIAMNLLEGRAQWFALKFPFVPHPPLYFIFSALVIKLVGPSILALRVFSVLLSVGATVLVCLTGSRFFGEKTGFVAGIIYSFYPAAVYWNRTGMVNNLLVLLSLLSMYFFHRFTQEKKVYQAVSAGFLAGLCFTTGFIGAASIAAVILLTLIYERKNLRLITASALLAPAAFILYETYSMAEYFVPEVLFQFARVGFSPDKVVIGLLYAYLVYRLRHLLELFFNPLRESISESAVLGLIVVSLMSLAMTSATEDAYHLGFGDYLTVVLFTGFIVKPLYFIKKDREKNILLAFTGSYFTALLILDRGDHMTMAIYPYLVLMGSNFFVELYRQTTDYLRVHAVRFYTAAAIILVFHPAAVSIVHSTGIASGYTVYATDVNKIREVTDYVNDIISDDSTVIGYSWMTNLINARLCVFGQSAAYDGHEFMYYSGEYPKTRFTYDCNYKNADLIILTHNSLKTLKQYEEFDEILSEISGWDTKEKNGFTLYMNPAKKESI